MPINSNSQLSITVDLRNYCHCRAMTTDSNIQLSIAVDDCHCSALSALQYKLEVKKKQYFCVSHKVIRYYVNLYG